MLRAGAMVDNRTLDAPFAIEFVHSATPPRLNFLTVIDRRRQIVQVPPDEQAVARPLPSATQWQSLAAVGSDRADALYVLEAQARQLLEYRSADVRLIDPPRVLLDAVTAPSFPFDTAV